MRKLEVEHCDLIPSHSDTVRQIQEKIPEEQEIRGLADFFKVFADATRIRILCVLSCSEMCVCDLAQTLDMTQSAHFSPAPTVETDEIGSQSKRGEDGVLFTGGQSY